jgi:hypothetical protein
MRQYSFSGILIAGIVSISMVFSPVVQAAEFPNDRQSQTAGNRQSQQKNVNRQSGRSSQQNNRPTQNNKPTQSQPQQNNRPNQLQAARPNGVMSNNRQWFNSRTSAMRPALPRPSYRPPRRPGVPVLNSILGITFGTLARASVDALYRSGYTVTSYDSNNVYMQNVRQFGVTWQNAGLYYDNSGLYASQFEYTSPRNGLSIFNIAYSNISNIYGAPIDNNVGAVTASATWWGGDSQGYITLNYASSCVTLTIAH